MLNRANVGLLFKKTLGQLSSISSQFEKRPNAACFIFRKGSGKFFSDKALGELLEKENLKIKKTQIITVANQKGGVGKTSTVLSQARNLNDLGFRILVIDTDQQANTTKSLLGKRGDFSLYNILEERDRKKTRDKVKKVITKVKQRLDVLPANDDCSRIDLLLSDPKFTYNPATLIRDTVIYLGYDFVFIDTSPSFSSVNIACIASSNRVICPVPLASWEIDGIEQVSKVVQGINDRLETKIELDFLVTKFQKNETTAYEEISKIKKLDGNLLSTLIPAASAFKKAQKDGLLGNGKAYKETLNLTREILENCRESNIGH